MHAESLMSRCSIALSSWACKLTISALTLSEIAASGISTCPWLIVWQSAHMRSQSTGRTPQTYTLLPDIHLPTAQMLMLWSVLQASAHWAVAEPDQTDWTKAGRTLWCSVARRSASICADTRTRSASCRLPDSSCGITASQLSMHRHKIGRHCLACMVARLRICIEQAEALKAGIREVAA